MTLSGFRARWWRLLGAGALLASLAAVPLAAPSAAAQEATPAAAGEPAYYSDTEGPPVPGGVANFLLYEDPDSLNPLVGNTSIALQVSTILLEGLAYNDPDGAFQPQLAAELPTLENGGVSEDLLTVTWKLKPDLLWSDGEPVTSEDVRFTWEAVKDAANGSAFASQYALIEDVETPDPQTAVVRYSAFNAGYLDQFPWILPQHAAGEPADMANWDFNRNPVGTGPFMLQEWSPGEFLITVKNPNYREEGKPYLDGVNFLVVPAEESRTARMIEGEGHIMLWAGDEAEEQIEAAGAGEGRTAPGIWVTQLHMNLSRPFDDDPSADAPHPALGDLRVREAITLAVNRERINTELLESRVFDIDSTLDVGWLACEVEPFAYDPERAMALLDAAGWTDADGDGVREATGVEGVEDGTPLSLMMNSYTGFSTLDLVGLAVQEDLKNVGVETRIENQEFAVIFGTWDDGSPRLLGDFDLLLYDSGFFAEPGAELVELLAPDQVPSAETPGGRNIYRWVREDVGEWLQAANSTPDTEERRANFCNVATAMREDIPTFPLFQFSEGSVYANAMHGFTVSTWEYATWDAENWWVEQG
jgi:peptide/nickel transport system substrate-binding protein